MNYVVVVKALVLRKIELKDQLLNAKEILELDLPSDVYKDFVQIERDIFLEIEQVELALNDCYSNLKN